MNECLQCATFEHCVTRGKPDETDFMDFLRKVRDLQLACVRQTFCKSDGMNVVGNIGERRTSNFNMREGHHNHSIITDR
jgi:hypothetical protein